MNTVFELDVRTGETTTRAMTSEEIAAITPSTEELSSNVRSERDKLLSSSDWTQVADAPVDQAAWATYRQALRDITQQAGFPENIIWPTMPE